MARPVNAALAPLLSGTRVVPVLTVPSAASAGPLTQALAAGGARCAEVTFRTPDAEQTLKVMAGYGTLAVGAGTVLTPEQAERAVAAGARFIVSPGYDEHVVARCRELDVPVVPGIATAGELMRALADGCDTVKLFPAQPLGGIDMLSALSAPFHTARFMPTGGITLTELPAYLAHPSVLAVGGSWIAPPDLLNAKDFEEITRRTAEALRGGR
ncbi:keto-deoxy-phosphogluconate aldolase [Streptomyces maremycinicus]|nr:keto-deoxy-phosphogluconate aldolase [Streptomyces sp. B9173]